MNKVMTNKEEVIKNLSLDQFRHTFDQLVKLMMSNAYVYYDYALDTDTRKTRQIDWGFSDKDIIDLLGDFINDSGYAVDATAFYEEYGEEARIEAERLIFEEEED